MSEQTIPELPKRLAVPRLLASLPDYLKDHNNYDKIQKTILEAGSTPHSHGEVLAWSSCVECQKRQLNRLQVMKRLGFKNAAQYKAWQKIHAHIKERVPFAKYNS